MRDQRFGICHKYMPVLKSSDALNEAVCPCKASGTGGISLGAILGGSRDCYPALYSERMYPLPREQKGVGKE